MFAPLYLSNYCVNGCLYCPYHLKNKTIPRKKLTQEEIRNEVIALQDMGHKRLAIEAGEDPVRNPIEYILESIDTIYSIKHKNGAIRRVNVNIAATSVEEYKMLHDAGIGTYILFQETYDRKGYEELHPTGPKSNYAYHTEAMDRVYAYRRSVYRHDHLDKGERVGQSKGAVHGNLADQRRVTHLRRRLCRGGLTARYGAV